jgi:hypothetical protein
LPGASATVRADQNRNRKVRDPARPPAPTPSARRGDRGRGERAAGRRATAGSGSIGHRHRRMIARRAVLRRRAALLSGRNAPAAVPSDVDKLPQPKQILHGWDEFECRFGNYCTQRSRDRGLSRPDWQSHR